MHAPCLDGYRDSPGSMALGTYSAEMDGCLLGISNCDQTNHPSVHLQSEHVLSSRYNATSSINNELMSCIEQGQPLKFD
jgi:hypothetical protein